MKQHEFQKSVHGLLENLYQKRRALNITRGICSVASLLGLRHICPTGKRHIPRERFRQYHAKIKEEDRMEDIDAKYKSSLEVTA